MNTLKPIEYRNAEPGRRADYDKMLRKAMDYTKSREERSHAEDAVNMIVSQIKSQSVSRMREDLRNATQNGDKAKLERITEQAKRMDKDFRF